MTPKSLKELNQWQIWLIIAINTAFLYGVVEANAIEIDGVQSIFTDPAKLVPFGVAIVVATVLNGLLTPQMKARLVFLRWRDSLPGHRAFTEYVDSDPRVDPAAIEGVLGGPLPTDPSEQNRVWFRLYKMVENDPSVSQVHRDFLLTRDYTALAALFLLFYGSAGFYWIPSTKIAVLYAFVLFLQFVMVRQSAVHYGIRFVANVLARVTSASAGKGDQLNPNVAPPGLVLRRPGYRRNC